MPLLKAIQERGSDVPFVKRAWRAIDEPRVSRLLITLAYALIGLAGFVTYVEAPRTILSAMGDGPAMLWTAFMVIGGVIGALFTLRRLWWCEQIAILFIASAGIQYVAALLILHYTESGNRLVQAIWVSAVVVLVGARFARIWGPLHEPGS